jgi:toluene monooxygenase system protein E
MSETPTKKLRTWSRFGQVRRVPTEYEVLTHDLNYTARKNRKSAFESNPTSPANMWYLTYRDKSPLRVEDWNGFRDPDEMTYRKYVTLQDEQETVIEGVIAEYAKVDHDAHLSDRWIKVLASLFTPMRFPVHAFQMSQMYLTTIAPSSYINNAAAFAAGDCLRRVSLVAYRTRQLQLAHPGAGFGDRERAAWEADAGWQGTRRALETALIAYDWGECLTAMNLVLRPMLDEILIRQLGTIADANEDQLTWLLLFNLAIDSDRNARWSAALARYAIQQRPENAEVLRKWVDRWSPRADAAAEGLAQLLQDLPEAGRDAAETLKAAREARQKVLSDAGVLVGEASLSGNGANSG